MNLKNKTHLHPLWDLVKISFGEIEEKTELGIILPESLPNKDMLNLDFYPTVVGKGFNVTDDIQIGDKVLVPISRTTDPQGTDVSLNCWGIELKEDDQLMFMIRQTDIYAIVK